MISIESQIAVNHRQVRDRIAAACARANRTFDEVTLVAVTKYAEESWLEPLVNLGVIDFGESRPQQLANRAAQIRQPLRWHLIGKLQRNKIRRILPLVECIHSIDSERLLRRVDEIATELQLHPRVLLEVNISGELSKEGFTPAEIDRVWPDIVQLNFVQIVGLMTMAPLTDDEDQIRAVFRGLRDLRDQLGARDPLQVPLPELSMGMSHDFEIAIEEGATFIRVGSGLFEGLQSAGESTS